MRAVIVSVLKNKAVSDAPHVGPAKWQAVHVHETLICLDHKMKILLPALHRQILEPAKGFVLYPRHLTQKLWSWTSFFKEEVAPCTDKVAGEVVVIVEFKKYTSLVLPPICNFFRNSRV